MTPSDNTLHTLLTEFNRLEEGLVQSGGEVTPDIENQLVELADGIQTKADSVAYLLKRSPIVAEYYRAQAKIYTTIARALEGVAESVETTVKMAMEGHGLDEVIGTEFVLKLQRHRASVDITDPALLPEDHCRIVREPNKASIKAAIERGEKVPGAQLEYNRPLSVKPVRKT